MRLIEDRLKSIIEAEGDKTLALSKTPLSGYVALAVWDPGLVHNDKAPFDLFRTTFRVPQNPLESDGQTIFIFPGVQPSATASKKAILQPVLQWGPSASGGANSWSAQSYYVRGTPETGLDIGVYSERRDVQPGDPLTAAIRLKEVRSVAGKISYFYSCEFEGIAGTWIGIDVPDPFVQMGVGLELYSAPSCSSLPAGNSIILQTAIQSEGEALKPAWQLKNVNSCSLKVSAVEHGGVQDEILFEYDAASS
ncbi:hypothetical protein [Rhizobium leguminosarum]|uniref:hypothetical protein n=1 Tax=Rhizobium leguminosarum TaxID=384 RepID=UPI000368614F|nr:hypothetical protein [Rhizobium leguminosarum]